MNETVRIGDVTYVLAPEPVRTSLTDGPHMLYGFQVRVLRDGELRGIKTCFVGRIGVHARSPEALRGTMEDLVPVLYEIAFEKVRARLREGAEEDEILFG